MVARSARQRSRTIIRLIAAGKHHSSTAKPPMVAGFDGVAEPPDGSLGYVPVVRSPWGTLAERVAISSAAARPMPEGPRRRSVRRGRQYGVRLVVADAALDLAARGVIAVDVQLRDLAEVEST